MRIISFALLTLLVGCTETVTPPEVDQEFGYWRDSLLQVYAGIYDAYPEISKLSGEITDQALLEKANAIILSQKITKSSALLKLRPQDSNPWSLLFKGKKYGYTKRILKSQNPQQCFLCWFQTEYSSNGVPWVIYITWDGRLSHANYSSFKKAIQEQTESTGIKIYGQK